MFWSKKSKKNPSRDKPSREDLMKELHKNAQQARDAIGEENLEKLAAQITGKKVSKPIEPSPMEQAKEILRKMDKERLADNIRALAKEDKD